MTSQTVKRVSECFIKPQRQDAIGLVHHSLLINRRIRNGSQNRSLMIMAVIIGPRITDATNQPIYLTPFELLFLNLNYSQKGLLFAKPLDFSITTFLDDLRFSLSATLTHFYPLAVCLATRIQQNPPSSLLYIDPENTPGVKLVHANVLDVTISDILTSPDVPLVVHSFFDLNDAINHDGHTIPLLSIQVTELADGIFIGGSVNHIIADGTSFWHFMSAWSEIYRTRDDVIISRPPIFERWNLQGSDVPAIATLPFTHHDQFIERPQKPPRAFEERFFHFSSTAVAKLKAKANEECNTTTQIRTISSLQAVSALLWRCMTRARRQPSESETVCKLMVSNRSRVNPSLSDDYFGSPIDMVRGATTVGDVLAHGLGWAAVKIHEAVKNHDDAAVKKRVESWYRNPVVHKMNGLLPPNTTHIGSSLRFDMYGCEFGLGKAVAARSGVANKADGKVTMYPGWEGGGSMDVEVCLLPKYMMDLECDQEFINAL